MAFYNHYSVSTAKISVKFYTTGTTNLTDQVLIGLLPTAGATSTTDPIRLAEAADCQWTHMPLSTASSGIVLSRTINLARFFGRSWESYINAAPYRGSSSSDPSELAFFAVWAASPPATDSPEIYFDVQIEFTSYFSEPTMVATS